MAGMREVPGPVVNLQNVLSWPRKVTQSQVRQNRPDRNRFVAVQNQRESRPVI